jgi:zinc transport system substrate-binding protein
MKNYKYIIFALVVVVFVLQIISMDKSKKSTNTIDKPIVVTSTFSLYDIAKHLSGGTIEVIKILPDGVDAHSYEPTPKLMTKISKSTLVVYSGAGLEPWTKGFDFKNKAIDMSRFVHLRELDSHEHEEHHHHEGTKASKIDPHYWLSSENMIIATKILTKEFIKIMPKNKTLYLENQTKYIKMLKDLDKLYNEKLNSCKLDTIIVNHNAFSYLLDRYHFHVKSLTGFSPDKQVTPKDMIRVMNAVKEHNVSTIFFESFVSDKAIKSLAKELNVKFDTLQPLGNITKDESMKKLTYEQIMKINLEKISEALVCR